MAVTDGPVLFLVPARGGSRRIPGKNARTVAGIPLVGWAVRTARRAAAVVPGGPHPVVCSTDDPELAAIADAWGAEVLDRPAELSTDTATSVDVAIHALDAAERTHGQFRALVLLQPTSPLTDPVDVCAAIERFDADDGETGIVSVTTSHPARLHVAADGRALGDTGADLLLTGAFYVVRPDRLLADRAFLVPGATRPHRVAPERSVDVDEPADLALADALARARSPRPVRVGDRELGTGHVVVIAEAGVNHNGDVQLAHRLVDAAAEVGADVVKFQTFDPEALAAFDAPTAEYQRTAGEGAGQRDMLARLALPAEAWAALQRHAAERGLTFLSTPFDDGSAELLDRLDVPAFKVGSGELTNTPFLERLARRGRPILLSTGMADMVEVAAAVDAIELAGSGGLALLHCVSAYPTQPEHANLRAIGTLRAAFAVPVGWSDHTPGTELPMLAVAAGASVIEKHLTLDRSLRGPDHAASLDPAAFTAMVAGVRLAEVALGDGIKQPVDAERAVAAVARRSLHWSRSVPAGEAVAVDDLVAVRPGTGLSPARAGDVVGRRTARAVDAGRLVVDDDLEPPL